MGVDRRRYCVGSRPIGSERDFSEAGPLPSDVRRFSELVIDGSDGSIQSITEMLSGMAPLDVARLVVDSIRHPDGIVDLADLSPLEKVVGLRRA
jgi:hypothetical protein